MDNANENTYILQGTSSSSQAQAPQSSLNPNKVSLILTYVAI